MSDYYDQILAMIPLSILGFAGGLQLLGYSMAVGATFGAMIAVGVMGHAMFVNTPGSTSATHPQMPAHSPEEMQTG